jgi:hypothetical protein
MYTPVIVKLAFAARLHGSMGPWIHAAKERIEEIVRDVTDTHPNTQIEVALVAYRDYGDVIRRRVVDFSSPTTYHRKTLQYN